MNVFPKSYRFADVLSIINGRNQKKVEAADGQYPIYGSGGIMGWANDYICPENTVVIGRKGSINNPIYVDRKFWNVDTAFGLVPNRNLLLPRYLFYFCVCFDFEKLNTTVTIPSLTKTNLMQIKMFLPPLGEQEKIICRLDKLCHLIELKKEQLKQLDVLAKSRFIEMFGDPVTNPKEWESGTIRDIASEVKYGTSSPATEGGKYIYLRMNNITYDGHLDLSNLKHIDLPDDQLAKYQVQKGDVLFNRTNSKELVGKTCVFKEDIPMVIAGYIIRVRVNARANPEYLSAILNSKYGKRTLLDMCKSIVGQANINAQELQNIDILIPPLALQNEFAAFIEQLDKSKFSVSQQQKTIDSYQRGIILQLAGGE